MVMTKNFHTVNGQIIGETTAGSPRVDYLTDALGSVTATVNQSAQVVNTYRYKPFGATLAKTGTGPDPAFGWAGTHGYRPTGNPFSSFYVMLRHYDELGGRWPTVDPTGFYGGDRNLYRYVLNKPVSEMDPTGLGPGCGPFGPIGVARSSPRYSCYQDVCSAYMKRADTIESWDTYFCGGCLASKGTSDCLPDERSIGISVPFSSTCFKTVDTGVGSGRNSKSGWGPWGDWIPFYTCPIECSARFCYWITEPNDNALNSWMEHALAQCGKSGGKPFTPFPPEPSLPKWFTDCYTSAASVIREIL